MNRVRLARYAVAFALVVAAGGIYACGNRAGFEERNDVFEVDGGFGDADLPHCGHQCSFDGRSVIDTCTNSVVETCLPDQMCGAAACRAPCEAAAADRHSNGCEFFVQAPFYAWPNRYFDEDSHLPPPSCFATYVVNTSPQPAEISLELEGKTLDVSGASFRTNPGSSELIPHTGPIAPGESVILFLSDADPELVALLNRPCIEPCRPDVYANWHRKGCPEGVVPAVTINRFPGGTERGSSFRLSSNMPVSVTSIYPFGGAESYIPAATLLLPVATWTKENIIVNGWEKTRVGGPTAQIVAAEDDTEVTIIPTRDIQAGVGVVGGPAHQPIRYRLDRGEYLQFAQNEELTGSIVTSTKPTTVFGGHTCAYVPADTAACEILTQQIPAFAQWGSEYVGVGYRPRLGDEHEMMPYRIVAARDGTQLEYDPAAPPGAPTTLNAGQAATFSSGTGDAFVVRTQDGEHPIYLAAYMTGAGGNGSKVQNYRDQGDPEFVNVVPTGQYLSSYSFYADPAYAETSLVIVRAKSGGAFRDVWLECAGKLEGFKPVGTKGEYEWMRVDLSRDGGPGDAFDAGTCSYGVQRMHSEGPFTATLWGWDYYASYAYPGGMAQRKLVNGPLGAVH